MSAPPQSRESLPVAVLGAGPAGLTAAYRLVQRGQPVVVFEADHQVGGLARTVVRDGYRFDLGGHRFYTKSPEVEALWTLFTGPVVWAAHFLFCYIIAAVHCAGTGLRSCLVIRPPRGLVNKRAPVARRYPLRVVAPCRGSRR